jgi:tetraacyldisaccharide 4'-kinase
MVGGRAGSFILSPLGALTRVVARERRRRPRARVRVLPRVVSVGNLAVGGVGKTPMVACLVKLLAGRSQSVGVVTGAYGARPTPRRTVSGSRFRADLARGLPTREQALGQVGDEAVMLADAMPDTPVAAGRPKSLTVQWFADQQELDWVILDDGFQHHRLARDIDVVLLNGPRPFGSGRVLPAGRLREGPEALAYADIVVFTGGKPSAATRTHVLSRCPGALVLDARHAVAGLRDEVGRAVASSSLHGVEVCGVCGLGTPESFERTLADLGARAELIRYTDHHAYSSDDLRRVEAAALGRVIVTTAKDAAKWQGRARFRYVVVDVEMQVSDPIALLARLAGADPGSGGSHDGS